MSSLLIKLKSGSGITLKTLSQIFFINWYTLTLLTSLLYYLSTAADRNTNTVCVSQDNTHFKSSVKVELCKHITIWAWQHRNETQFKKSNLSVTQRHKNILRNGNTELTHLNNVNYTLQWPRMITIPLNCLVLIEIISVRHTEVPQKLQNKTFSTIETLLWLA